MVHYFPPRATYKCIKPISHNASGNFWIALSWKIYFLSLMHFVHDTIDLETWRKFEKFKKIYCKYYSKETKVNLEKIWRKLKIKFKAIVESKHSKKKPKNIYFGKFEETKWRKFKQNRKKLMKVWKMCTLALNEIKNMWNIDYWYNSPTCKTTCDASQKSSNRYNWVTFFWLIENYIYFSKVWQGCDEVTD